MIPYRDNIPCEHPAIVTWVLIFINTSIFLYCLFLPEKSLREIFYLYGLVPIRYTQPMWAELVGFPPSDYWPFLTSMFLHAGGIHLVLNMWLLWIFGDNVEDRMGPFRFIIFYLLCGLAAGIIHLMTNSDSSIATVGASGAIAGILGAYYVLFPFARIVVWIPILFLPIFIHVPAIAFLGFWVIIQIGLVLTPDLTQAIPDVAVWGHLGGFVSGLILYRFLLRPGDKRENSLEPW